jgi:hypothetical protein
MSLSKQGPTATWKAVVLRPEGTWSRGADLSVAISPDELLVMFGGEFREELSLATEDAEQSIRYAEDLIQGLLRGGFVKRTWSRRAHLIRSEADVLIDGERVTFKVHQLALPLGAKVAEERFPPYIASRSEG